VVKAILAVQVIDEGKTRLRISRGCRSFMKDICILALTIAYRNAMQIGIVVPEM